MEEEKQRRSKHGQYVGYNAGIVANLSSQHNNVNAWKKN